MPSRPSLAAANPATLSAATLGRTGTTRWLLLAGFVGPAMLVVAVVAAGVTWPGFDHRVQNISDLGGTEAPHPRFLNGTFVVVGALVTMFAFGLRRAMLSVPAFSSALIGVFGISLAIQGFTPCTPGCAAGSTSDVTHATAALLGVAAVAIAAMLTAVGASGGPVGYRRGSLACGVAVLVFLGAWLVTGGVDPGRWHAGVYQRLLVATALTWLAGTAVVAVRTTRTRR